MVTLDTVLQIIPALSVSIAAIYYAMNIRHQRETRQAQLFMQVYEAYRSPQLRKQYYAFTFQHQWKDYADYMTKYGPDTNIDAFTDHGALLGYFEGIGVLVKKRLVDIDMVNELLSPLIRLTWEKMRSMVLEARLTDDARTRLYHNFEYLYDELNKYIEEHPEL